MLGQAEPTVVGIAPSPPSIRFSALSLENRQHPCHMNALLFRILAKLWAFNFGHPCPPSKKGEVLLLGQAEPTMVGIEFDRTSIPLAFRRASVCVCLVGFASLQSPWAHTLRHPCLARPSRNIEVLTINILQGNRALGYG